MGVVILITLLVDQLTKTFATSRLKNVPPTSYLGGTVQLSYAQNTGAFGSLGSRWPDTTRTLVFILLPIMVLGGSLSFALRAQMLSQRMAVALAFIVAGGVGNVIDRIKQGYVTDFLRLSVGGVGTNVFNFADVCLMLGTVILVFTKKTV